MNATNRCLAGLICTLFFAGDIFAEPAAPTLQLETKILLGDVSGRIDHLAIDLNRQRLFVAELGNNTLGVVDLKERNVIKVITGFKEPQGVAYVPSSDTLYITNGGDGSVRVFKAGNYEPAGQIDLGSDADNIRVDAATNRIVIGYGNGALAMIDPTTRGKTADISLKAHPEGFQLGRSSGLIFVNVPSKGEIAIVDRAAGKQIASWSLSNSGNFPMALDDENQHVIVMFRSPASLGVFSMRDGGNVASLPSCGDADDVFIDKKRHRVYVSCGSGFLDVFDAQGGTYRHVENIPTVSGARTSLFVPELDRFLLAVAASAGQPAAIWVYRPTP
jgi:DNA-binding beta-propeller fold protein YncE